LLFLWSSLSLSFPRLKLCFSFCLSLVGTPFLLSLTFSLALSVLDEITRCELPLSLLLRINVRGADAYPTIKKEGRKITAVMSTAVNTSSSFSLFSACGSCGGPKQWHLRTSRRTSSRTSAFVLSAFKTEEKTCDLFFHLSLTRLCTSV
jgi:hypothetical protein